MTTKLKGSHPWLVILCCPSDQTIPALPSIDYFRSFISEAGAGGLFDFWLQISRQRLNLTGSRVLGWYRLTETVAQIDRLTRNGAAAVARAAASANGEDISGYRYTLALFVGSGHFGAQGEDVVSGISVTRGQPGWRWCSKCQGLAFWDGSRQVGTCAASGRHDHSGSGYYSVNTNTTIVDGEAGWRWCRQCQAMVFSTSSPATCPAGGTHALTSSGPYVIRRGSTGAGEQNNWKRCNRCQGLAFHDSSRSPGICPLGGPHNHSGSGNYSVPTAWAASVGAFGHETGHGFGFDHAFGGRSGDFSNDSRPGAYGDWTDIMSWNGTAKFATPRFTPAGGGLSAPALHKLGWVVDSEVTRMFPGAGVRTVALVPLYGGSAGVRMIQVIRPADNRIYTASYRPATGWDQGLIAGRVVVHAQRGLYSAGQDSWSWCESCEGMIFGGSFLCPAGGLHNAKGSSDYGLLHDVGSSGGQTNWRWCSKCQGLAFAGNNTNGFCPAGGAHEFPGSFDYAIPMSGSGQSNWRWCNKCQGLGFGGNAMKGACPGGGLHDHTGSRNYVLSSGSGPNRQNNWRWCNKCQGLFFAGRGTCAGGDTHQLSGSDYALALDLTAAFGQTGWKWCSKCLGLAFHDGSRLEGRCPGGGRHDHSTSGPYTVPTDAESRSAQQQWFLCRRCSGLNFLDATRGAGRCSAGGNHVQGREYEIAMNTTGVPGDTQFRWCNRCECLVRGNNPAGCAAGGAHQTSAGGSYVIRIDPSMLTQEDSFWRTCSRCSILMRLATPDGSAEMPCPLGGTHTPTGDYFLTMRTYVTKWRRCRRCELLALWDGSRSPGRCAAGGTHDHSGSDFYFPPRRKEEAVQVVADNLRAGGRYVADIGGTAFDVISMNATSATVRVTT